MKIAFCTFSILMCSNAVFANSALSTTPPTQKITSLQNIASIYQTQWQKADNRQTCAIVALPKKAISQRPQAKHRAANFHGGWAVAYDLPNQRSAYGIAGAGTVGSLKDATGWSQYHVWPDGSAVGWGLEGNTGPGHLAFLYLNNQGCLYNVWSNVSEAHLIQMLNDLRMLPK